MGVKQQKLLRPGHEHTPNPKSSSEIRESYENTGMAGLAARSVKSKYFLYKMIMLQGEGEGALASENGSRDRGEEKRGRLGLGKFSSLITRPRCPDLYMSACSSSLGFFIAFHLIVKAHQYLAWEKAQFRKTTYVLRSPKSSVRLLKSLNSTVQYSSSSRRCKKASQIFV